MPIHIASESGNIEEVGRLIALGININLMDEHGWMPIHLAAQKGYINIVEKLVQAGADVNSRSYLESTPLYGVGTLETAKFLIEKGADVNAITSGGESPIFRVADPEIALLLISKGADINLNSTSKYTPLHIAVIAEKYDIVKLLVTHGSSLNETDNTGKNPLDYCFNKYFTAKDDEIMLWLIKSGAKVTSKHSNDDVAIYFRACETGRIEIIKYFIDQGLSVNMQDEDGKTPLHIAAMSCVEFLVSRGADLNSQDRQGRSPLHEVTCRFDNSVYFIEWLIKLGANRDARDFQGETPLHRAAACGSVGSIFYLIKAGADINVRSTSGKRPYDLLFTESKMQGLTPEYAKRAQILFPDDLAWKEAEEVVNKTKDVNARDEDGDTALNKAVQHFHKNTTRILLDCGADPNIQNNSGKTPLHYAYLDGDLATIKFLKQYRAREDIKDNEGKTPVDQIGRFRDHFWE